MSSVENIYCFVRQTFFDGLEKANRFPIAFSSDSRLGINKRVKVQDAEIAVGQPVNPGALKRPFIISNPGDFSQTIQFAQVCLETKVLEPPAQFVGQLQRQFIGGQPVIRVQVLHGCFDASQVVRSESAANVQVLSNQGYAMHDSANTADDDELNVVFPKARQQCFIVLWH
jgi:hypothetical protein